MKIDVLLTAENACPDQVHGKTAVVIDILRATSTIVTALANGCHSILPVASPETALSLAEISDQNNLLLGGERKGLPPQGFHLGNSPREYTKTVVRNKKIIFTTTNGTKAIKKASTAREIILASILNMQAAATRVQEKAHHLVIICAGTRGKFALEDTIAAGLLISTILKKNPGTVLSDIAKTAYHFYLNYHNSILYPLQNSINGRRLIKMGLTKDVLFCAQENKFNIVPQYMDGVIMQIF